MSSHNEENDGDGSGAGTTEIDVEMGNNNLPNPIKKLEIIPDGPPTHPSEHDIATEKKRIQRVEQINDNEGPDNIFAVSKQDDDDDIMYKKKVAYRTTTNVELESVSPRHNDYYSDKDDDDSNDDQNDDDDGEITRSTVYRKIGRDTTPTTLDQQQT